VTYEPIGGPAAAPSADSSVADGLPLTGERTVPDVALEQYWFVRHLAVYQWLIAEGPQPPAARTIVDAGCGEGYGAAMIQAAGARVIALDYDDASIDHVRRKYPHVHALRVNLVQLPLADESVDAVVSLQVIEHLWDLRGFLAECWRVLRPGGFLIVSTPNRPVFSPGLGRGERPVNPFHVEEFDAGQVADMLRVAGFEDVSVVGLHHGGAIAEWEEQHGSIVAAHVQAALANEWPESLRSFLPLISVADFTFAGATGSQDLIGVARRPDAQPGTTRGAT